MGKSTLFNALTKAGIDAENFPFCTIEPNAGIVSVPDPRLAKLADIVNPERVVPATMEFVDIAGLVAGASRGAGLGNQFLGNLRETDAIAHVVRCFEDENLIHVAAKIDPASDIEVINTEFALADLETVEKAHRQSTKMARGQDRDAIALRDICEKILPHLNAARPLRSFALSDDELGLLRQLCLLTLKPTLYVANVDEGGFEDNPYLDKVREIAAEESAEIVVICNKLESEIAELDDDDKAEFLADPDTEEPGLNRLIRAGYRLLGLHTYFTAGIKEVRAWTIPIQATASQAAGRIHTDFEKGFIRAEIIGYDDYIAGRGEPGAKEAGKWRLEGRDYIVRDGDIVHFRFKV